MLRNAAVKLWSVQLRANASTATANIGVTENVPDSGKGTKRISRALEIYLRNAKKHEAVMARERADFEMGRRHLANIMGLDINALSQVDIDNAIAYLFPSGLTDKLAKPIMRPPDEILPKAFHRFSFDDEGRPAGSRFYTLSPNFYTLLSEIGMRTHSVNRHHTEYLAKGHSPDNKNYLDTVNLSGTTWLSEDELSKKMNGEKMRTGMYASLIMAFEHLCSLPGSAIEAQFIHQYRKSITAAVGSKIFGPEIPQVQLHPENNRRFATVTVRCKDTMAEVTTYDAGTGEFDINGLRLDDFRHLQSREILLCPMIVAGMLGRVDVKAKSWSRSWTMPEAPNRCEGQRPPSEGGMSSLPRAVRHGAALGIAALYPHTCESLRLSGLLTSDPRVKERSKVNQPGARAKWIWKRR